MTIPPVGSKTVPYLYPLRAEEAKPTNLSSGSERQIEKWLPAHARIRIAEPSDFVFPRIR
jgi:hypothetical protein